MISHTVLRQIFLIAIICALSLLLAENLYFIFDAVLGAIILAILSIKPIQFLERKKFKTSHAEIIFFIGSILAIALPLLVIILVIKNQWHSIFNFIQNYSKSISLIGMKINERFGVDLVNSDLIKSLALKVSSFLPKILNSSLELLTTLGVMYFLLYFFIREGSSLRNSVLSLLPLRPENRIMLDNLTHQSVLSNTLMMPLVAFVQAIIAYISYLIAGVPNSFIWFLATFVLAMLPFFGAALVYIPLGVLLFFTGHETGGIFILVWGLLVVSSSDNFLRIFFMKKYDNTHPLITFMGVLAGLNIFGFLGIIFGPLCISLLLILIKIYKEEYKS